MNKITPLHDNVIVRVIPNDVKIGSILLPKDALEESTLAEVLIPNQISYHRDGSLRTPFLKKGMRVRIPKGTGTGVPESLDGEKWLAIPEDCIYYIIEGV